MDKLRSNVPFQTRFVSVVFHCDGAWKTKTLNSQSGFRLCDGRGLDYRKRHALSLYAHKLVQVFTFTPNRLHGSLYIDNDFFGGVHVRFDAVDVQI